MTISSLREAVRACARTGLRAAGPDRFEKEFLFPEGFRGFDGHFPGNPILPGVAHILAAQDAVEGGELGDGRSLELAAVSNVKFTSMVRPGVVVRLTLEKGEEREGMVSFSASLEEGGRVASRFRLLFRPAPSGGRR